MKDDWNKVADLFTHSPHVALYDVDCIAPESETLCKQVPAANGQSLQVRHDYFAHAHIWGFDVVRDKVRAAKQLFPGAPRMHLFASSSTSTRAMHNTGLAMGSRSTSRMLGSIHEELSGLSVDGVVSRPTAEYPKRITVHDKV